MHNIDKGQYTPLDSAGRGEHFAPGPGNNVIQWNVSFVTTGKNIPSGQNKVFHSMSVVTQDVLTF